MQNQLVFWIDQNKALLKAVELLFAQKKLQLYTLEKPADALYLVPDMNPAALVVDIKTLIESAELRSHLKDLKKDAYLISVGDLSHRPGEFHWNGHIAKPLEMGNLLHDLEKLLRQH